MPELEQNPPPEAGQNPESDPKANCTMVAPGFCVKHSCWTEALIQQGLVDGSLDLVRDKKRIKEMKLTAMKNGCPVFRAG